MENATYIALSRQTGLMRAMELVANNIANSSTTSYKGESLLFSEHLVRARSGQSMAFVGASGSYRNVAQGDLVSTGNSLDLAINGDAYFTVDTQFGPRYTRDGRFRLDPTGQLVTATGLAVQGEGGPITIPPDAREIKIGTDGTVSTEAGDVGRLTLVAFADPNSLARAAGGLYIASEEPEAAVDATIAQGAREDSNVVPVLEISRMIEILRSFQSNQHMIETEHELQRKAIERITRDA